MMLRENFNCMFFLLSSYQMNPPDHINPSNLKSNHTWMQNMKQQLTRIPCHNKLFDNETYLSLKFILKQYNK